MYLTKLKLGTISIAIVMAALAISAATLLISTEPTASAQESPSCGNTRVPLCLTKETIGGSGTFRFDYVIDDEDDQPQACLITGTADAPNGSETIQSGETVGVYFICSIRVTEAPQSGWQLVDIDCDFNPIVWDVTPISRGVLIVYKPEQFDSVNTGIHCTFTNQEVRQPLNLGGLFAGQPTPLPTARPAAAPAATAPVISPPRTGDAGLK